MPHMNVPRAVTYLSIIAVTFRLIKLYFVTLQSLCHAEEHEVQIWFQIHLINCEILRLANFSWIWLRFSII